MPSGILTFLFSDIQGSTPLWEKDPQGMAQAVRLHHDALRAAIEGFGGQIFKTVGDETEAVFKQPGPAVRAAVAAQRALAQAAWGKSGPLLVRMGLHTGQALWEGDDYAQAHTFNRVARIMSCGHGGQILISKDTERLLRSALPEGIGLRDMGSHRLKGLSKKEHLFQAVTDDLPADFPPLKSIDVSQNHLPVQLTPFIGREKEIKEVCRLLQPQAAAGHEVRLLTLTGPGGIGKTRLALQAAHNLQHQFADGVFFVDLASLRDASFVLLAVKRGLALGENSGKPAADVLQDFLSDKELLLVMDNFEQVMPAAGDLVRLLQSAPRLKLLVTSRTLLRVYGENSYQVESFEVPDLNQLPNPQELAQIESIQLFSSHAQAVKPGFTIDQSNGPVVGEICRRLDGLPLAIELASARIRLLTPQQMLQQLEDRFRFLRGGARNLPTRQQTLLQTLDWSYDLLDEHEQTLFKRLGVFAGGCTSDGLQSVSHDQDMELFTALEGLIDHSLLRQDEVRAEPRFTMLQTIRDYALKRLKDDGQFQQVQERFLDFCLAFAEEANSYLESEEQDIWLDRVQAEYDNLSAALRYTIEQQKTVQGLRLAKALRIFWFSRAYLVEGRKLVDELLSMAGEPAQRAQLLEIAGFLARYHGDYQAAETYIGENLTLARELADQHAIANAQANMGFVYLQQDRLNQAKKVYAQALAIYDQLGNEQGTADAKIHLGQIAFYEQDGALAQRYYEQSLAIWQRLGDKQGVSYAQQKLGDAALVQQDWQRAQHYYRESLQGAVALGFGLVMASALEGLALIAASQSKPNRALRLAAAASNLREERHVPASKGRRQFVERGLAAAYQESSAEDARDAWQTGQFWDLDQATGYALERSP